MTVDPDPAAHAGIARFPRDRSDLTSTTRCPGCLETLTSVPCAVCGLDVGHPVAAELALVSTEAALLLDERVRLIGRIRLATATAAAVPQQQERPAATVTAPAVPAVPVVEAPARVPWETSAPPVDAGSVAPAPSVTPTPAPGRAAGSEPRAPRRSSVQVLLLVVGVSLVSVAAIFFLVYAFITYGLVWRTAIIAAVTIAAFATASLLRRRSLNSTAEGIGAFAVVLVYLDVFAIRANDLFSAASADGLTYWGAALVLSSAGLLAWHRFSGLRVGSLAAFGAVAPGAGLLAAGLLSSLAATDRLVVALIAAGVAGLVYPLARRTGPAPLDGPERHEPAERMIVLAVAATALVLALPLALVVSPATPWAAPVALVGVALVAAAHLLLAVRTAASRLSRIIAPASAALAVLALACAAVLGSYRLPSSEVALVASVVSTTLLALALARAAGWAGSRVTDGATVPPSAPSAARLAAVLASVAPALTVLAPLGLALLATADVVLSRVALPPWEASPSDSVGTLAVMPGDASALAAVAAVASFLALVAVFTALASRDAPARAALVRVLGWGVAALAVLAVPLAGAYWAVSTGWLLLAGLSIAALVRSRDEVAAGAESRRPLWIALGLTAGGLGYAASWATTGTWVAASTAVILLLVVARAAFAPARSSAVRAALLGTAVVLALVTVAAIPYLPGSRGSVEGAVLDSARLAAILAVALIALSAVPLGRVLTGGDRRTVFAVSAVAALLAIPAFSVVESWFGGTRRDGLRASGALPEPGTSIALGLVLLAGLAMWLLLRRNRHAVAARITAALAMPFVLAWTLDSVLVAAAVADDARSLGPVIAALLTAAAFLALGGTRLPRRAADAGVTIVATWGVLTAVGSWSGLGWLALLLAAVTALLLAVSADGLVSSSSPRRHRAWFALVLATAALWWRLADGGVDAVEAYTLPLAGALLLIGLLVWRTARRAGTAEPTTPGWRGPSTLVLAALVVAVVPSAIATTGFTPGSAGSHVQALLVAAACAGLLLLGSVTRAVAALRPYLDASALAGASGLVVVAIGRGSAAGLLGSGVDDVRLDAWLVAVAGVLAVAAAGQASQRPGDTSATPRIAESLLVSGLAPVLLFEAAGFDSPALGAARAVVVIVAFCGVYVAGTLVDSSPLTRTVGRIALGGAVVAGVVALSVGAVADVEWVSLPIAAALLVTGLRRLARTPALRSWPAIGGGLAVLLLPSLLATLVERPLWRLVAIGVVAVAVLVTGLVRRLQAPFVLGAAVALVHGVATFAPQVRAVYQLTEWWVWAGLGGVVIIVLAARYERSIATARTAVGSIRSLR
jgi:hypothetical protein